MLRFGLRHKVSAQQTDVQLRERREKDVEKERKNQRNICRFKKLSYLCNRNRATKIANNKVPWMSGLVSGLQNRVRRFESARNLQ